MLIAPDIIATPEHLAGARVVERVEDRSTGELVVWLTLDRPHPSFPGEFITVTEDYVTFAFGGVVGHD